MPETVQQRYTTLVAAGDIERDRAQEAVVAKLGALDQRLCQQQLARKSSSLGWMFHRPEKTNGPLKGLYLHGGVGRGKTMLMDMFFATSMVARKRRTHFHEFMLDVHDRVRVFRQKIKSGEIDDTDPIRLVGAALAEETRLLCFDEFHVTDIADAMIVGRLFTRLLEGGVVVVATSNVRPDELYKDGLNRALFLPFLDLLEKHMEIVSLESRTDFRLEKIAGAPVWYVPADAAADAAMDATWRRLTGGQAGAPRDLAVQGRVLHVSRAAMGTARFSFHELCEQPLAAADYLKIAREFHTLLVDRIPVMDYENRNAAKRFIILVDTLYDHAIKLIASADAEPDALYRATDGVEANEFRRTVSRLIEMRSQEYLGLRRGRRAEVAGVPEGIIDT